jgi:hypothetical protein
MTVAPQIDPRHTGTKLAHSWATLCYLAAQTLGSVVVVRGCRSTWAGGAMPTAYVGGIA